jgi:hypothetical protein
MLHSATAVQPATPARAREYFVFLGLPFGRPQLFAGLLLLAFAGQCLTLAVKAPLRPNELAQIEQGRLLLARGAPAIESARSPLVPVLAAIPLIGSGRPPTSNFGDPTLEHHPPSWRWRARLPFILIGLALGASLWYVARRLYGTTGGLIALTLYAFAPPIVSRAASVQPTIVAAWGTFGAVFTAIAVAHTLYAPREVVLWNWRRTLLLGISFALATATQIALVSAVLMALAFLLYLAPHRKRAAISILLAGCVFATLLLIVLYGFHAGGLWSDLRSLRLSEFSFNLLGRRLTWELVAIYLMRMPGATVLLVFAVAAFAAWKRPRYFGIAAPLGVFALLMLQGIVMPHLGGFNLFLVAAPFAFVPIAGVFTDLLETEYGGLVLGVVAGVLVAHAAFSISGLIRI